MAMNNVNDIDLQAFYREFMENYSRIIREAGNLGRNDREAQSLCLYAARQLLQRYANAYGIQHTFGPRLFLYMFHTS